MAQEHTTLGAATLENFAPAWSLLPREKPIFPLPHALRGLVLCSTRSKANADRVGEAKR